MAEIKDLVTQSLKDLMASGTSCVPRVSVERFALLFAELVASYPGQEISGSTTKAYYNRLCFYAEAELKEAIDSCVDRLKWFPKIAEIIGQIKNPPPCVHHLKEVELRRREAQLRETERLCRQDIAELEAEIARLQAFSKELAEERAHTLRELEIPRLEAEVKDLQKKVETERRRLQLMDQAEFLSHLRTEQEIPQ